MGLDMYLMKKTEVKNWNFMEDKDKHEIQVKGKASKYIKPERISSITEDIAQWRKANAIHNWFVQNVQNGNDDCGTYYVDRNDLMKLLELVNKVLENKELAPELLPTAEGFFFGSYEYDQYYFEDLEYTKNILIEILSKTTDMGDYYYHSSW